MSNSTFIAKRYHLAQKSYVDSKNVSLPDERYPKWLGDPSKPPKTGSPFLSLPTELRLQIYDYLTNNDVYYLQEFKRAFNVRSSSGQPTIFAYLYRSPGRVTKPHAISKEVIDLFHVCHLMREELIDACFSDRTFVLEASLYRRDAGGLYQLPSNPGPTAWVKKLVLLTRIEGNGFTKGIGDLRPLQQMTNLKVLHILFRVTYVSLIDGMFDGLERPDNVLKAVLECVPKGTEVHINNLVMTELLSAQFRDLDYGPRWFDVVDTKVTARHFIDKLGSSPYRHGKLSGSLVNHGLCGFPTCQEGLDCVNSHCKVLIAPTKLSNHSIPWTFELNRSVEQKVDEAVADLAKGDRTDAATPPAKKCVHGYTRCHECEKGLVRKLKCWSGQVYRY